MSGLQLFTLTQHTPIMPSTDYTIGNAGLIHWSHSLATAVPLVTCTPNQSASCAIYPSLSPFPQPTSVLIFFAQVGFPSPLNRPFLSTIFGQAVCSVADLPGVPSSSHTCAHYPFKSTGRPLHLRFVPALLSPLTSCRLTSREAAKGVALVLGLRNQCCTPIKWCGIA